MSAVAASTGSPNERRASASRSFSQSQDENTKLPDEKMPLDLQKVRIFAHVSGSFWPWKVAACTYCRVVKPCWPLDGDGVRRTWDENLATDCHLPVPALWPMRSQNIYQSRSLPHQQLSRNFRVAVLFLQPTF